MTLNANDKENGELPGWVLIVFGGLGVVGIPLGYFFGPQIPGVDFPFVCILAGFSLVVLVGGVQRVLRGR